MPNDTSGSFTGPYPNLPPSIPVPLEVETERVGSTKTEQTSPGATTAPPTVSATPEPPGGDQPTVTTPGTGETPGTPEP